MTKLLYPFVVAALGAAIPATAQEIASPAAPGAMVAPDVVTVRNISHLELEPGLQIVDGTGTPVGTVKQVDGNTIIITDGSADYSVPITQLYAYREGAVDRFASRLPKEALALSN